MNIQFVIHSNVVINAHIKNVIFLNHSDIIKDQLFIVNQLIKYIFYILINMNASDLFYLNVQLMINRYMKVLSKYG